MIEVMHNLGIYAPFVFFFSVLTMLILVESAFVVCQGTPSHSQKELSEYNYIIKRLRNRVSPAQYARYSEINDRLNRL